MARCPCGPPRPGPQPPGVAGIRWVSEPLWRRAIESAQRDPHYLERFPFQPLGEHCECDPGNKER
jgi:hypothetical protein